MDFSELVITIPVQFEAQARWAITGPSGAAVARALRRRPDAPTLAPFAAETAGALDGLLLAGALSAQPAPADWLAGIAGRLKTGASLLAIDWQADGPPAPGPDLDTRFSRGLLCRLLRQHQFGAVTTLVNHDIYYGVLGRKTATAPGEAEFVAVAWLAELPKHAMKVVAVAGQSIIVANTGRDIVAFAATCPHQKGGALNEGLLRGKNVVCPRHGYIWNVQTGQPVMPADEDVLPRFPVKIDAASGEILVAPAPRYD